MEIMPQLSAVHGLVDMVLTDPPYGTTACKWDSVIPFNSMWSGVLNSTKGHGAIVLTASQPFTSALGYSGIKRLKYQWVWRKSRATGHLNAKKMPMKDCEDVLVFYDKQPTYNPQGVIPCDIEVWNSRSDSARGATTPPTSVVTGGIKHCAYRKTQTGYPRQVLNFASDGATVHPTQKPVALFSYLIKTYTNPGETVLDFCAGSGTTAVAAQETGRRWVMIEKEVEYCEIIAKRLDALPRQ